MGLSQVNAPIYEALRRFRRMRVVPFDVPGHKRSNKKRFDFCAVHINERHFYPLLYISDFKGGKSPN